MFELIYVCFEFACWTLIPIALPYCIWVCKITRQIETKETYLIPSFSTLCNQQNDRTPLKQGWTSSWVYQSYGGESIHVPWEEGTSYMWEMPVGARCALPFGVCCSLMEWSACLVADLPSRIHLTLWPVTTKQKPHSQIWDICFVRCPLIWPQHPEQLAPHQFPSIMTFMMGSLHVLPSSFENLLSHHFSAGSYSSSSHYLSPFYSAHFNTEL